MWQWCARGVHGAPILPGCSRCTPALVGADDEAVARELDAELNPGARRTRHRTAPAHHADHQAGYGKELLEEEWEEQDDQVGEGGWTGRDDAYDRQAWSKSRRQARRPPCHPALLRDRPHLPWRCCWVPSCRTTVPPKRTLTWSTRGQTERRCLWRAIATASPPRGRPDLVAALVGHCHFIERMQRPVTC